MWHYHGFARATRKNVDHNPRSDRSAGFQATTIPNGAVPNAELQDNHTLNIQVPQRYSSDWRISSRRIVHRLAPLLVPAGLDPNDDCKSSAEEESRVLRDGHGFLWRLNVYSVLDRRSAKLTRESLRDTWESTASALTEEFARMVLSGEGATDSTPNRLQISTLSRSHVRGARCASRLI